MYVVATTFCFSPTLQSWVRQPTFIHFWEGPVIFIGGCQYLQTHLHADYGVVTSACWLLQLSSSYIVRLSLWHQVSNWRFLAETPSSCLVNVWTIPFRSTKCRSLCPKLPSAAFSKIQSISAAQMYIYQQHCVVNIILFTIENQYMANRFFDAIRIYHLVLKWDECYSFLLTAEVTLLKHSNGEHNTCRRNYHAVYSIGLMLEGRLALSVMPNANWTD